MLIRLVVAREHTSQNETILVLECYRLDNKVDQQKYGEIISDYLYFKTSDEFEKKIEKNPVSFLLLTARWLYSQ